MSCDGLEPTPGAALNLGDKTPQFTGKNVKIVIVVAKVTLRGPSKNGPERTAIEGIAKRTAGVGDVDNQLETVN